MQLKNILTLLFIFIFINPAIAVTLSPKHKTALKIECEKAIDDGLFLSKNKCYAEKTTIIEQYGYAWTDKLNDKTLARKIQLKCHILIDDGLFKYNQCIESKVNLALGIVREEPLQPPLEYVPDDKIVDENEGENSTEQKVKIVESDNPKIHEVYKMLKESVMFVRTHYAKLDFTEAQIQKAEYGTCSAVSIGDNLFATNAHCVLFGEQEKMSEQKISDFICILPITEEVSWDSKCNWAVVTHIDAYRDQAIISIIEKDRKVDFNPPAVKIKESNKVNIFDPIYTLGNPQGVIGIFTEGKITAINENSSVDGLMEATSKIYTFDAMIEQGNSGGGLFDIKGNLIGITSAGDTRRMGKKDMQQFNFAIAIDEFLNLLD